MGDVAPRSASPAVEAGAFAGQVVVVTGGSTGIGLRVARDFAAAGAKVVISSHDADRLLAAGNELAIAGLEVVSLICDVRKSADVASLAHSVLSRWGQVDILVNNAGYAVYRPFEESTTDEVIDIVDVNLVGAMRCTKAFLPAMIAQRSGCIVNMSSIGGETIITPNAAYCASKHGMVAWTKALRYELAHFNIRVNVVCPAHTATKFHDHPTFRRRDPYRRSTAASLTPAQVSRALMEAVVRDRAVTFVPKWQGVVAWALRVLPAVTEPVWSRVNRRRVAQLYEQIALERRGSNGGAG